jgi:hypothetical protein
MKGKKEQLKKPKIVIIWKFVLLEPFCSIQKYIFVHKNRTIFKNKNCNNKEVCVVLTILHYSKKHFFLIKTKVFAVH